MSLSFFWEPSSWVGFSRAQSTSPFQQSSWWWPGVSKVGLERGVTVCQQPQLPLPSGSSFQHALECCPCSPLRREGRGAPWGWGPVGHRLASRLRGRGGSLEPGPERKKQAPQGALARMGPGACCGRGRGETRRKAPPSEEGLPLAGPTGTGWPGCCRASRQDACS